MLNFDLEYNDWTRINFKTQVEPIMQLTACTVASQKKRFEIESTRVADAIVDGIYFFGGRT